MPPPFPAPYLDNSLRNIEDILQAIFVGPVVFHSSQLAGPSPFASPFPGIFVALNPPKYQAVPHLP